MKVMISQPMGGKSEQEILLVRNRAKEYLESKGYEVIDSIVKTKITEQYVSFFVENVPLYYLGRSISSMSECQAVYFCEGWENYRGCLIEHGAAKAYGLKIIYEGMADCE